MKRPEWITTDIAHLLRAIKACETTPQLAGFLYDIATVEELKLMSKRLETARLLYEGASLNEIKETTGLSLKTIRRVKLWFTGGLGGYEVVLKIMHRSGIIKKKIPQE